MGENETSAKRGIHYGWVIVGSTFVMLMATSGLSFYNLAVFLRAFTTEFGFSVAAVSGASALYFVASGIAGLWVGSLLTRFDARPIILVGVLVVTLSLLAIPWISEIWHVYAFYIVMGLGNAACAMVPATTLITRWFVEKRTIAMSLSTTGLSVGGIVLTPISVWLIDSMGFAAASRWIAGLFFALIVIAALFARSTPDEMGLTPDGGVAQPDETPIAHTGMDFPVAVRSRFFHLFSMANLFVMMAEVGTINHQFSLVDGRVGAGVAALSISILASGAAIGRLVGGWILTRVPIKKFAMCVYGIQAFSLVVLAYGESSVTLLLGAGLFGLILGNALMMPPLMTAEAFGVKDYSRIFSVGSIYGTAGSAAGPIVFGVLFEMTGGYVFPFLAGAAVTGLAMLILWAAGPVDQQGMLAQKDADL